MERSMKNNIHRKQTRQLNWDKSFCSWTKNSPKAWRKHKKQVRRGYRRKVKGLYDTENY